MPASEVPRFQLAFGVSCEQLWGIQRNRERIEAERPHVELAFFQLADG